MLRSGFSRVGSRLILCAGLGVLVVPQSGRCDAAVPLTGKTAVTAPAVSPNDGELLETPNQRRKRLGQPIVDSYPSPEYGVAMETPNQRRKRLGETPVAAAPESLGILEQTPNQRRMAMTPGFTPANRP